jgi:hypothetical protein
MTAAEMAMVKALDRIRSSYSSVVDLAEWPFFQVPCRLAARLVILLPLCRRGPFPRSSLWLPLPLLVPGNAAADISRLPATPKKLREDTSESLRLDGTDGTLEISTTLRAKTWQAVEVAYPSSRGQTVNRPTFCNVFP